MKSPTTDRDFTPAEERIVTLGFPPFLILNQQERKAIWDRNPPKTLPVFFDPRIEQDKELRAAHKREATAKRIYELRKSKGLIDDPAGVTSQREDNMAEKYVIKPLDKVGHPVMRAVTSIPADSNSDAIDAKVIACVERGGKKVVAVTLENTLGEVALAWSVDSEGVVAPADVTPYKAKSVDAAEQAEVDKADAAPAEATETIEAATGEESDMAKKATKGKAKAKKAAAPKAKKVAGEVRKGSKTEIVAKLLKRDSGCTSKQVLEATGWPSVSMPAQAKAAGLKLRKEKVKGEVTRYFGS